MLGAVADVPAADQPHGAGHDQAEHRNGGKGRHAALGHAGVERAERQDAGLLVEVLHRNRAAGTHQVVTAVLQERIHRHDQVAAHQAQEDQEGNGHPDIGRHVQAHHQEAHGDAQGDHRGGLVQPHVDRSHHGAGCGADGHHAAEVGGLRGAVAQRCRGPGEQDDAQIARHTPEQRGRGQRDLAQLVLPQARVAGSEVAHQLQRAVRQWLQRRLGARDVEIEDGGHQVQKNQAADGGFGRGVYAGIEERDVDAQQHGRELRPDQLAAQQDAQNDGGDRQALDPAIGLDQLRGWQQLGEDAVLGGRIGRSPQAHDRIGQQRMHAQEHHQTARHLDRVRIEHDLAFGHGVGERAHKGRQEHIEKRKHRPQGRNLPGGCLGALQQFDGSDQQCLISQRAEELR